MTPRQYDISIGLFLTGLVWIGILIGFVMGRVL